MTDGITSLANEVGKNIRTWPTTKNCNKSTIYT